MATRIYQVEPRSGANGAFLAQWFGGPNIAWADPRLEKTAPLLAEWCPAAALLLGAGPATPVLFNPDCYAFSEAARDALVGCPELEFLPVCVEGAGVYYIMHVLAAIDVPAGTDLRRVADVGNVVEIYGFPLSFESDLSFFRVRQPPDSPAGRVGFVCSNIYANEKGASLLRGCCGEFLELIPR